MYILKRLWREVLYRLGQKQSVVCGRFMNSPQSRVLLLFAGMVLVTDITV